MAKVGKTFEETRETLRVELERTDGEIRELEGELKLKLDHARALRRAYAALGGSLGASSADVVTLEGVMKVIVSVFADQDEMSEEGLRKSVINRLKNDLTVNQHGLGLRVSQAIKRLKRSAEGVVLKPTLGADEK